MKTKVDYPMVYVQWVDHCSEAHSGWKDVGIIKELEPIVVETIGFLLKETEDKFVVAGTVTMDNDCTGEMCIERGAVKKYKVLK